MEKFETFSGKPAPLPMSNVDTDIIIPKQFLKTIKRSGLGQFAFNDLRFDDQGQKKRDFILHDARFDGADILIAGDNFGCGSSREHAPWALMDYGFRVIIAPSFADIFYQNSLKNGLLPICLAADAVQELSSAVQKNTLKSLTIDLENQLVKTDQKSYEFKIDNFSKKCLLEGLDDIGLTLQQSAHIDQFDKNDHVMRPWVWSRA